MPTGSVTPWLLALGILFVLGAGSRVQALAVTRDWVEPWVGRKVAHIGFGAAVLFSWVLFADVALARWFAALPALGIGMYFLLIATGVVVDRGTVRGGSRSGTAAGLMRGPVLYALVFAVLTVVFCRTSPVAMAALAFMTFGDSFAEIVGKTVHSPALPWSREKTVAGSLAALVAGWCGGLAGLWLLAEAGFIAGPVMGYFVPMAWVALAGTAVESLPFAEIDNATATLTCAAVGVIVFA